MAHESKECDHQYFGNGASVLSNFATLQTPIEGDKTGIKALAGFSFASSEHAYQALKLHDEDRRQLAVGGGSFGTFEDFDGCLDGGKKQHLRVSDLWRKRKMVGVIAKMAVSNKQRAKKLGLRLRTDFVGSADYETWAPILRVKFASNPKMAAALLRTGDERLVEFDRHGNKRTSFWGFLVQPDGSIKGENRMGQFLMRIRSELATGLLVVDGVE